MTSSDNIIFFDSECILCSNLLKLLIRIDKQELLKFASLQSDFARSMLPSEFVEKANFKSVAFFTDGQIYYYSTAVIKIFAKMGFPWSVIQLGYLLPKKLRDALYMKVSDNRYSWFGKSDQCIIPDEKLNARLIR